MDQAILQMFDKLRQYDTPTICNVIEMFDFQSRTVGYMDASIKSNFPEMPPMVGFAATATGRAAIQPKASDGYATLPDQVERFAELDGPAVVVLQDLDNPHVAAMFGEIMCTTFKTFGATGLVTNGAGRDLEQVRAIDFPVFTSGTIASHGYFSTMHLHIPVHVGGLVINPGDLLHGDANGVTTIPLAIASEVADAAAEFITAERTILDILEAGVTTVAQLREAAATSREQMNTLRARVSRKA